MDADHRELLRRLFTTATERLESAHEAAISGQSSALSGPEYVELARTLGCIAQDAATLAETARILAGCGNEYPAKDLEETR